MTFPSLPSTPAKKPTLAILCDFDGTACPMDVCAHLYSNFAGPRCKDLNRLWDTGEITTIEEALGCFETIQASQEEMESGLVDIPIDPALPDLVSLCAARGYPLAIVSDGFRWYIEVVLRRYGLDHLPVFANEVAFTPDGPQISFPWYDPKKPRFGTSKSSIIESYQACGYTVAFIGDGLTDSEVTGCADLIYAKSRLLELCLEQSIAALEFKDLSDIVAHLRDNPLTDSSEP